MSCDGILSANESLTSDSLINIIIYAIIILFSPDLWVLQGLYSIHSFGGHFFSLFYWKTCQRRRMIVGSPLKAIQRQVNIQQSRNLAVFKTWFLIDFQLCEHVLHRNCEGYKFTVEFIVGQKSWAPGVTGSVCRHVRVRWGGICCFALILTSHKHVI